MARKQLNVRIDENLFDRITNFTQGHSNAELVEAAIITGLANATDLTRVLRDRYPKSQREKEEGAQAEGIAVQ